MSESTPPQATEPIHEDDLAPPELTVFSPDKDLAVANLNRRIDEAETSGQVNATHLELFKLQLELARVLPRGASGYVKEENDRVEAWQEDFDRRNPPYIRGRDTSVKWDLHPGRIIQRASRDERWRIVGINPEDIEYEACKDQENKWEAAARAEQDRVKAELDAQAKRDMAESALQKIRER